MYDLIGCAMEVYNVLGRGLEEPIYQEALALEFDAHGYKYEREKLLRTWYKGSLLRKYYQADFYCNNIILELKSVSRIVSDHRAQLFNYMRITKSRLGILINFGERNLHSERYFFDYENDDMVLLNEANSKFFIA